MWPQERVGHHSPKVAAIIHTLQGATLNRVKGKGPETTLTDLTSRKVSAPEGKQQGQNIAWHIWVIELLIGIHKNKGGILT